MFKCLYSFSSPAIDIIEIKRTGLPDGAPLSDIYKWLILSRSCRKVFEFDFKSMGKDGDVELREFVEGSLRFDQSSAHLKLFGREYMLQKEDSSQVPGEKLFLIESYLNSNHESFRELKPSDVTFFKQWIRDPEVILYSMTKFHRLSTDDEIVDWFQSTLFDSKTFQLGIVDPSSRELIGYAGIAGINEIDGNGEYFIFIGNKSFWGKGIASMVTKKIVEMGFQQLKLHRIFLTASSHNPGALRAYEKAGFVHEGKMREAFYRNGQYSDKIIMGLLRKD